MPAGLLCPRREKEGNYCASGFRQNKISVLVQIHPSEEPITSVRSSCGCFFLLLFCLSTFGFTLSHILFSTVLFFSSHPLNACHTLQQLKEPELLDPLVPAIKECLEHRHSYVRKNAALAVFYIHKVSEREEQCLRASKESDLAFCFQCSQCYLILSIFAFVIRPLASVCCPMVRN